MTTGVTGSEQSTELGFLTLPHVIEEIRPVDAGEGNCPECGSSDCTGCEGGDGSDPCDDDD